MQKGDYVNAIRYDRTGLRKLKKFPQFNDGESLLKDAENALKAIKEMEMRIGNRDGYIFRAG
jgi:hypothetical protein